MSVVFGLYWKKGFVSRIILLVLLIFLMRGVLRAWAIFEPLEPDHFNPFTASSTQNVPPPGHSFFLLFCRHPVKLRWEFERPRWFSRVELFNSFKSIYILYYSIRDGSGAASQDTEAWLETKVGWMLWEYLPSGWWSKRNRRLARLLAE